MLFRAEARSFDDILLKLKPYLFIKLNRHAGYANVIHSIIQLVI